ncbi:HD domain-containing protein [Octadecabacter ascidiaceicola]|nr:HD domain-containing protein [Octadecabacter ascidiaceicola]
MSIIKMFLETLTPDLTINEVLGLPKTEIRADIDQIYRMFELERTIRFFGQYHWETETSEAEVKPGELALENVAAHTFQVASSVQLLAPHFQKLNKAKAIELALLHDQLEVFTGDKDPVGEDGYSTYQHREPSTILSVLRFF